VGEIVAIRFTAFHAMLSTSLASFFSSLDGSNANLNTHHTMITPSPMRQGDDRQGRKGDPAFMRRNDREITDRHTIDDIIRRSRVCRLGLCDGGQPYIVPMSFGYDGAALYFHAADGGRKLNILRRNRRVCFEVDILHDVVTADEPCGWGMKYESVIGFGRAEIVGDGEAREQALGWIMRQYGGPDGPFPEAALKKTLVIKVRIDEVSGKARL
jgi:nitroimidazol reductase NimA-like FMN-containing flavoprotein (pyridoxamine 5'-phosphate oxidase superfamily)